MRRILSQGISSITKIAGIKHAQAKLEIRQLWDKVRAAKVAFDQDKDKYPELAAVVDAFFAWEKKHSAGAHSRGTGAINRHQVN
jgi:hypothetical protein